MINIEKLIVENFLTFQMRQEIEFDNDGLHYIIGQDLSRQTSTYDADDNEVIPNNGSGKSSLPLGIEYALYGSVTKEEKIPVDKIINKASKRDMCVELFFSVDGRRHHIQRFRKHHEHKDALFLFRFEDGEWKNVTRTSNSLTQEIIDSAILINSKSFLKTMLFARDDLKNFLKMGPPARMEIFDNIAHMVKFKSYLKKLKEDRSQLDKEILVLKSKTAAVTKSMREYEGMHADEKERVRHKRELINKDIGHLESRIRDITGDGNLEKIFSDVGRYYDVQKEVRSLGKKLSQAAAELTMAQASIGSITKSFAVNKQVVEKATKELEGHQPTKCHECSAIQDEDEYQAHKKTFEDRIEQHTKEMVRLKPELQEASTKKKSAEAAVSNIKEERDGLLKRRFSLSDALKAIIDEEIEQGKQNDIKHELDTLNTNLTNAQESLKNVYDKNIAKFEKMAVDAKAELAEVQDELKQKEHRFNLVSFWITSLDFKQEHSIKQHVMSKIIPVFNQILQNILDYIYDGSMRVVFDSFLNEDITYNDEEFGSELSTGERAKVNLCINLAIFELTNINLHGANILFLDEVFTSIDEFTILQFLKLFEDRYSERSAVYVISHSQGVKQNIKYKTQIILRKKREFDSRILVERAVA